jgi:two-component system CheB/CheR fusion protein
VDFSHYKQPTIRRRLHRRMVLHKIATVEQYLRLLQQDPAEVTALYQDILIHVTHFFREPDTFETLKTRVFPQLIKARAAQDDEGPIRVWVPGCSTGEEAYSVAIALLEFLGESAPQTALQIFATDISENAIEHARAGVYGENITADVSAERLRRFFGRSDGHFRIGKQVRDLCVFARQDLTRDPPFSRLDLIVCRNVLIYLAANLQSRLMNVFHYALKPSGFLMLGGSETIGSHVELFSLADKKHRLYVRKQAPNRWSLDFPAAAYTGARLDVSRKAAPEARMASTIQAEATRALTRYGPAAVVVDNDLQIIHFHGQTGPFLEPASGDASLNLMKMAREGLLFALRSAFHDVRKGDAPVRREGLHVADNAMVRDVSIEVIPLAGRPERHFLVVFEEARRPDPPAPDGKSVKASARVSRKGLKKGLKPGSRAARLATKSSSAEHELTRLQQELAASREYLQSIIQDLEAANEEILSSNEELQSTNEELDTAKEELQSTNEELNTVNEELQGRNEEMSRVNSDLVNLLGSVQIAIVMVAQDLRIRRFTPMAEKVLNLIPTDIGRPITDLKPNIDCPDLEKLIAESIDSMTTIEREVSDRQGHWYAMRIRPYKNLENRIDGAVLAFFDVEAARQREMSLREARSFAEAVVDTVREPLMVLDEALRVRSANQAFYRFFKSTPEQIQGKLLYELGSGQWNISALRSLLEDILPKDKSFNDFVLEADFPELGRRRLLLNARRIERRDGTPAMILLAAEEE